MGYLRCEGCGSKALTAASTCPKCSAPFSLHDARGERVPLKKCSGCGIMHRRDRGCHWCGDRAQSARRSSNVTRTISGIAAVALVAGGSWSVRERAADVLAEALVIIKSPAAPSKTVAVVTTPVTPAVTLPVTAPTIDSAMPVVAPVPQPTIDSLHVASAERALVAADSIRWVPAVARTWVNVRADASREGDVVGVIKPTDKAMLGIGRSGWRQVKSPDVTGWVDPRLFEADSLRTRG